MADNYAGTWNYRKNGFTGGGDNDVDGIDVTESGFLVYSSCFVTVDVGEDVFVNIMYEARESGATADDYNVIIPVNPPAYAGDIRWHRCNDPIWAGDSPPTTPFEGLIWVDTSS